MIALNTQLAKEAYANALNSGRVFPNSNPHAFLLQALVHLNFAFKVRENPSAFLPRDFSLDDWTTTEIVVADTINWLISFLQHSRCEDIEQLLKDVNAYRSRHPDTPKGVWPYSECPR